MSRNDPPPCVASHKTADCALRPKKPTRKSCKCRVMQKLRNLSVVYHKTKNPFGAKLCMYSSFQLLLFFFKVNIRRINSFIVWILVKSCGNEHSNQDGKSPTFSCRRARCWGSEISLPLTYVILSEENNNLVPRVLSPPKSLSRLIF